MTRLLPGDASWPRLLTERLGEAAPPHLRTLGNLTLLRQPLTALFCSTNAPAKSSCRPLTKSPNCATQAAPSSAASTRPLKRNAWPSSCAARPPSSSAPPAAWPATASRPRGNRRSPPTACCCSRRLRMPRPAPLPNWRSAATNSSPPSPPKSSSSTPPLADASKCCSARWNKRAAL